MGCNENFHHARYREEDEDPRPPQVIEPAEVTENIDPGSEVIPSGTYEGVSRDDKTGMTEENKIPFQFLPGNRVTATKVDKTNLMENYTLEGMI